MTWMRRSVMGLSVVMAGAMLGGCGARGGAQGVPVAAQYQGLQDKSVAIVIYAQPATLNEFPGVREEVSQFVTAQLRMNLPTCRLLSYQDVIAWQNNQINWYALTEKDIGKHFSVDRVLYIEVLDYSTKRNTGYSDLQGRLRAQCKVTEVDSASLGAAWTGLIDVTWPEQPLDPTQTNENALRLRTLEVFADKLVRCFYDHQDAHR